MSRSGILLLLLIIAQSVFRPVSVHADDSIAPRPIAPWVSAGAGALMLGGGLASHYAYPHSFKVPLTGNHGSRGADVVQYLPLAAPWVLKAAGVHTRSGWEHMAVSQAFGVGIMAGSVKLIKSSVSSLRPDGSDYRSFPSGHTAWAFMGATVMAMELADSSPWYALGGYTLATAVAVERVVDAHHYPADVVAGAGIGVLSAQIGYMIGDLICGRPAGALTGRDISSGGNYSYLSVATGLSLPLGRVSAGGTVIQRLPALTTGVRGGWAIDDHWGLGVELGVMSTPLITDVAHDRTYVKNQTSIGVSVVPYYNLSLSDRISIQAEAGAGYRHNMPLKLDDADAVTTGTSSPVGRVGVGCVIRMNSHFSARAQVGYEVSRYRYTVRPSVGYHISEPASAHGVGSAILVSLSSRYEF
ncbi:MAG: phosphatase PAP2 family protein [Duncaniella sp.]|nr:phosphatase PAP2 family protein [Duncaniella sp.]